MILTSKGAQSRSERHGRRSRQDLRRGRRGAVAGRQARGDRGSVAASAGRSRLAVVQGVGSRRNEVGGGRRVARHGVSSRRRRSCGTGQAVTRSVPELA